MNRCTCTCGVLTVHCRTNELVGRFRFSHSSTLNSVFARLGLYRDHEPLLTTTSRCSPTTFPGTTRDLAAGRPVTTRRWPATWRSSSTAVTQWPGHGTSAWRLSSTKVFELCATAVTSCCVHWSDSWTRGRRSSTTVTCTDSVSRTNTPDTSLHSFFAVQSPVYTRSVQKVRRMILKDTGNFIDTVSLKTAYALLIVHTDADVYYSRQICSPHRPTGVMNVFKIFICVKNITFIFCSNVQTTMVCRIWLMSRCLCWCSTKVQVTFMCTSVCFIWIKLPDSKLDHDR